MLKHEIPDENPGFFYFVENSGHLLKKIEILILDTKFIFTPKYVGLKALKAIEQCQKSPF